MTFQRACGQDEVEPGEGFAAKLSRGDDEVKVAVLRDEEGRFHALDDTCTHGDVSLAEGDVEDGVVECWAHGATFDLETGAQTLPAPSPVRVYPVDVREDGVYVDVEEGNEGCHN